MTDEQRVRRALADAAFVTATGAKRAEEAVVALLGEIRAEAQRAERDRVEGNVTALEDALLDAKGWLPWSAEQCHWPDNRASVARLLALIARIEASRTHGQHDVTPDARDRPGGAD